MQNHPPVTNQDIGSKDTKAKRANWSWELECIGVIAACVALFYAVAFFSGYMPISTLPVKEVPAFNLFLEACKDSVLLWPPNVENPNPKFPAYSPDERWYITVGFAAYRDAEELRLYQAGSNRLLGIYSFKSIAINCWAKDSNGLYYIGSVSGGFFDPFNLSQIENTPKEILVPCRNDLEGAPIWMKAYWKMVCKE